jgi:hypothetical protein
MTAPRGKIIFDTIKFRVAWHVRAVNPSQQAEHITGFPSEAAAKEWIVGDGAKAWLSLTWLSR